MVATEVEALQLEYNWIKEFDPRFNVRYRDDKTYPVLAVTLNEEFPRLHVYRGPAPQGRALLRALRPRLGDPGDPRPAAARVPGPHLQRRGVQAPRPDRAARACSATSTSARRRASGAVSAEEHREIVDDFCDFLSGRTDRMVRELERRMAAGRRRARVRAGRPAARRRRRAATGHGAPGRGARRRHRRRCRGVRRGRARSGRAGLPRARRAGARPARMGRRQGRAHRHRGSWWSASSPSSTASRRPSRMPPTTPTSRCRGRSWCRSSPPRPTRSPSGSRACADRACRSGCRSAATSGPSPRRSPATRPRRSPSTSCAGPAT